METESVDAFAGGQVWRELAQPFAELADCTGGIAALLVIERYGEVNQGLQEEAPRSAFRSPLLFEDLVALEELEVIEEPDSAFQALGWH